MAERSQENRLGRYFNYANHPVALTGIILATVSGLAIIAFLIIDVSRGFRSPYLGLFAYFLLPTIFLVGLILLPLGMWKRRRLLIQSGVSKRQRARYPNLDFNDPRLRRIGSVVLGLTAINVVIFGLSSFKAIEETESVDFCGTACHAPMLPEFTAYQESPHSRVSCVECHIGPGASWFVRAKVDGLRQVWHMFRNTFNRPISSPIHDLRPARETCEECHWPAKHYGDKLRIFARFDTDEENTGNYTAMLLKTGGGRLDLGNQSGIHWWHIYSDNRIRYVAADDRREEIDWVELTTPEGEVRTYTRDGETLPSELLAEEARTMDCIDCHNRPTHYFESPARGLDAVLESQPELISLPYFKREALASIKEPYASHSSGVEGVKSVVDEYYRQNWAELYAEKRELVDKGSSAASKVYERSSFPEMKTDWTTHPNHIGHEESPGCWRCHDDEMATEDGEHVISIDCEICHAFLVEDHSEPPVLSDLIN